MLFKELLQSIKNLTPFQRYDTQQNLRQRIKHNYLWWMEFIFSVDF